MRHGSQSQKLTPLSRHWAARWQTPANPQPDQPTSTLCYVDELADPELAAFAAVAGLLHPAERHARVRRHTGVHKAHAGLDFPRRDALAARRIARQHARAKTEARRVGNAIASASLPAAMMTATGPNISS